ncbi:MAG: Roadblock/LC7 family protein [Chthoniobacteraceae bacterium]|nr:Roadblock/LC7 family protein [Chthoniobacteraceae bacterium]
MQRDKRELYTFREMASRLLRQVCESPARMIKFFQKLFRKSSPAAAPVPVQRAVPELASPVVKVETASLSLAAILNRFPADLKESIVKQPEASVMVALPLSTILKQLPSGSVKMSLASIYRQAPSGTFSAPRMEEKRLVEVPLGEIFKRVKPELLKRRDDQRMNALAEDDGIDVFGDPTNPFMVAPVGTAAAPAESAPPVASDPLVFPAAPPALAPEPVQAVPMIPVERPAASEPMRVVPPPPGFGTPAPAVQKRPQVSMAKPQAGNALMLALADISAEWPAEVKNELPSKPGAMVSLPLAEVSAGLAKGRVSFTWGQIRSWISPAMLDLSLLSESLEIRLPLRVVAPAFLKSSTGPSSRKKVTVTDEIPALFEGLTRKHAAEPEIPVPEPEPPLKLAPEPVPEPESEPVEVPAAIDESEVESNDLAIADSREEPDAESPANEEPAPKRDEESDSTPEAAVETEVEEPAANPEPAPVGETENLSDEKPAEVEELSEDSQAPPAAAESGDGALDKVPVPEESGDGVPVEPVVESVLEESAVEKEPGDEPLASELLPEADKLPVPNESGDGASVEPESVVETVPEAALVEEPSAEAAITAPNARTLGDIFSLPGKTDWSPAEIVTNICKMPQFDGALVSLQEGLVVAESLPDTMKGEDVAAFLPQIFSRLNQYSDEMKLGAVDDLLMRTNGAEFQVFRLGVVFFAVLGKPGQNLPRRELELIAEELALQTQK